MQQCGQKEPRMPKVSRVSLDDADFFSLLDELSDDLDAEEEPVSAPPETGGSKPTRAPLQMSEDPLSAALSKRKIGESKPTPKPEYGPLVNTPKPEAATGVRRSQAENSSMQNVVDRSEATRFIRAFGQVGAECFIKGKSFAEAREAYLQANEAELQAIWARGVTRNMARFALGCRPPKQR
jgi:hypothetical protein